MGGCPFLDLFSCMGFMTIEDNPLKMNSAVARLPAPLLPIVLEPLKRMVIANPMLNQPSWFHGSMVSLAHQLLPLEPSLLNDKVVQIYAMPFLILPAFLQVQPLKGGYGLMIM